MTVLQRLGGHVSYPGRRRRRTWSGNGRTHLEVRGMGGPQRLAVSHAAEQALGSLPGVTWASVDAGTDRVVVDHDASVTDLDLAEALASVERSLGVDEERFPVDGAEHPGDREPVHRHALALGADVAGLGFSVVGRLIRSTPLPVEVASLVTLVDNEPRLRHLLESHLGTPATDLGLALTNAVGQSLTQGPLGLVADGVHRVNLLLEVVGRQGAFNRAELQRWGTGAAPGVRLWSQPAPPRASAMPDGPVERYADRASLAGAAGALSTLAATRSGRRGAALLLAAVPKAARLGREAFAAHLDRTLCARDLLVLDPRVLRRLDRVDTLVVDGRLLTTGRSAITEVRAVGDGDLHEVHRRLRSLFDPHAPDQERRRGDWSLGPVSPGERRRSALRLALGALSGPTSLVLRASGRPVAVVGVAAEVDPATAAVLRQGRLQGLMVAVFGAPPPPGVDVDLCVDEGTEPSEAVDQLQTDGRVVAVVAAGGHDPIVDAAAALRRSDVGVELPALDGAAWSGDIIVNELHDVAFVLHAVAAAREVSRQSVAISITGSGLGALVALTARPAMAASRASSAVNLAALAGMGNGLRAVRYLGRHGGGSPSPTVRWHEMDGGEVLEALRTTTDGLSAREAARRADDSEDNRAPTPSLARSVLAELANPLTPILAGGAAASAAVGSAADAGIVAGVSLLNALVGGAQRFGAERAIAALDEASRTTVTVVRDGRASPQNAELLVAGDIVELRAGDAVPADCRILAARQLEVDESSLTGESEPVAKSAPPVFTGVMAERTSMLHEGTTVAAGEATAVVVAVGERTLASEILQDVVATTGPAGVEARLRELTSRTMPLAGGAGAAVLGLGVLRGRSVEQSIGSAVALAVAAVPEGLPILATMAQLASARRLSGQHALVRNPRAIEAIGRLQVLCTDKTGTLTEGRIRLHGVSDGVHEQRVGSLDDAATCIVAAGLRASPPSDDGMAAAHLTDQAVIDGGRSSGVAESSGAPGWERRVELPFEPARGYHAVLGVSGDLQLLSVKGAPEVVLPRCRHWRRGGVTVRLDRRTVARLHREVDRLGRRGLRILAVAEAPTAPSDPAAVTSEGAAHGRPGEPHGSDAIADTDVAGLTFLGFLMLSDPVRPTAAAAVRDLKRAGVDVLMVTGDHPSTAEGIAAELDILGDRRILTGGQLAAMSDSQLDDVLPDVSVFARVTPTDKVRVVAAWQRRGVPVAMTGDGANDAPAIRLADVGIAVGNHSTAAARRAADLIVTDERIETIVDAVIEGRSMWASLREALAILLGGNLGEIVFIVGATAVTGTSPLSARQLLVVNLLTDVAPALAIALRPPRQSSPEALLEEGPEASLGASLDRAIAVRAAATAAGAGAAWTAASVTGRHRRASTVALVALVGTQLAQTVTMAGTDPKVLAAGLGSAALLTTIVQTPGLSHFFGCTPLGPVGWGMALGGAAVGTAVGLAGPAVLRAVAPPSFSNRLGIGVLDGGPRELGGALSALGSGPAESAGVDADAGSGAVAGVAGVAGQSA